LRVFRANSVADPVDLLVQIDPNAFQFQPDWGNGMVMLQEELLLDRDELDRVFSSWLDRETLPVRLFDEVLYHVCPAGETGDRWVERSIQAAVASGDSSLIETLLLTLGSRIHFHEDLVKVAFKTERQSKKIKHLLKRIGGFDYLP
jgi:hypothetical protein